MSNALTTREVVATVRVFVDIDEESGSNEEEQVESALGNFVSDVISIQFV
jgi:hypothetical protein